MRSREAQGDCSAGLVSVNPGRYVGATPVEEVGNEGFEEQFEILTEGLDSLNAQALELQTRIAQNVASRLS